MRREYSLSLLVELTGSIALSFLGLQGNELPGDVYSSILRELQTKGKDARFKKTERGKFMVAG